MEREHRQGEKKAEGGPLDELGWIGVFVIAFEHQIGSDKDIFLVGTEFGMRVDDTEAYEGAGGEEAVRR